MRKRTVFVFIAGIAVAICAFLMFAAVGMLDSTANTVKAVLISVAIPVALGCAAAIVGAIFDKLSGKR